MQFLAPASCLGHPRSPEVKDREKKGQISIFSKIRQIIPRNEALELIFSKDFVLIQVK